MASPETKCVKCLLEAHFNSWFQGRVFDVVNSLKLRTMLKIPFVQIVCLGSLAGLLSLVGNPAALAETYSARCYRSTDKDGSYDKCSVSLNEQTLQIDYEDDDFKKDNVAIDIKRISGFTDTEISRVDAGRVFAFGIAGVFWKKKYLEYTVNYIDQENNKKFVIFRIRDKKASAFKAQLSNVSSPDRNLSSFPVENSISVPGEPSAQPSPEQSLQVPQ